MSTWHRCGILVPSRLATSQMVSPGAAATVLPSRMNSIRSVISDVLAEIGQQVVHRIGRRLPEAADRGVAQHRLEVTDRRLVERRLFLQQVDQLARALAARRALAAALV